MKSTAINSRSLARGEAKSLHQADPSQVVELSNGRYTVRLDGFGSGCSSLPQAAVTRWTPDTLGSTDGLHIYLRDLDDATTWSAAYLPTRSAATDYEFRCDGGVAQINRHDHGIESALQVCVHPSLDCEIRLLRLTNHTDRSRTIQLTSYMEWILGNHEADAQHPAFSKLFIETMYVPDQRAVIVRRRPRAPTDPSWWGVHSLIADAAALAADEVEFETNRARFIGRGRSIRHPLALQPGSQLSGDQGPVLDPIAALRCVVRLQPGESAETAFLLGAGSDRQSIDRMLAETREPGQLNILLDTVRQQASKFSAQSTLGTNGDASPERYIVHPPHRTAGSDDVSFDASYRPLVATAEADSARPPEAIEALQFFNGVGGFSADGREYVIHISSSGDGAQRRPPMPWVNVIANEKIGCVVTESGAGYTWAGNSRLNRLTAWHNDPIVDPHSEALWIRDEEAGQFWSPMPGPTPGTGSYQVRHGFGYTTFEHETSGLFQSTTIFVAREDPVKFTRLRVENRSGRSRRLSLFSYLHWLLGGLVSETVGKVSTAYDRASRSVLARNPARPHYDPCVAFSSIRCDAPAPPDFTCDRAEFLGRFAELNNPKAIAADRGLDGQIGNEPDACAAWRVEVDLAPGAAYECTWLLGEATDDTAVRQLLEKFNHASRIEQEFQDVQLFWRKQTTAITVETPAPEINLMVNGWLLYQNLSCRMWGRSANYQPGGAFGFRDQLQDSAAFVYHEPQITRDQILRHASQQFDEGDVLHWWHPDTGYGLRTRFSDDLLWLPYLSAEYVRKTGDESVLDEVVPFLSAPPLGPNVQEQYLRPEPSGDSATLYEHCCRALDRGLTTGPNGLPLIGCGDWNDGFSRVGRAGRGESVWLGFFIDHALENFLPLCRERGDLPRVDSLTAYREKLRAALNSAGWDGRWYRRAYYDNGQPLGSATSDECQVDAIAQAWSVISGVAPPDRAQLAMSAVEKHLVDDDFKLIRLLTPAFDRTENDPGYIKGYLRGIRENGGQYTHGVLWVVRAMAELGRGSRAVELLRMLSPVSHTRTAAGVNLYQTEPYVVAADVYGEPPHVGRGGWTWYTGSAGWMYRVAIESILGISTEGGHTLMINPAISSTWPECRVTYQLPNGGGCCRISIQNPAGKERGVTYATLDGVPAPVDDGVAKVPLPRDGQTHQIVVRL